MVRAELLYLQLLANESQLIQVLYCDINKRIRNTRHNGIFYVLICIVKLSEIKKVKFYEEIYIIECFKKNIFS